MTYDLPASYDPDDNRIVALPQAIIPILAGRLHTLEYEASWETNKAAGVQASLLVQERLITPYTDASGYDLPANYAATDNRLVAIPKALIPIINQRLLDLIAPAAWIAEDAAAGPEAISLLQDRMKIIPFADTLLSNATRAWWGDHNLTDSGWEDLVLKTIATPPGLPPTIGEINGKQSALFSPPVSLIAPNFARPQPHSVILVISCTWNGNYTDGASGGQALFGAGGIGYINAGVSLTTPAISPPNTPTIVECHFNGDNSEVWRNGVVIAHGNAGSQSSVGIVIGRRRTDLQSVSSSIALISLCDGENWAEKTAAIRLGSMEYYEIY